MQDTQTGVSAFHARIELDTRELGMLKNVELYPGMPAKVMILLGKRTRLDDLVTPVLRTFGRAFRET